MVKYRYTPEMLAEAARNSRNIAGVMRYLGVRISGGSHVHIRRRLQHFGIDTSHFTGHAHNRGTVKRRLSPAQWLVKLPEGARRTPGHRLRRALLMIGLPESCELCGIGVSWHGLPLTLHVDHINGDFLDNRPVNLRFVCPNCHSQTATYAGRRRDGVPDARVVYDPEATTVTGIPIGRRLPRQPQRQVRIYRFKGP